MVAKYVPPHLRNRQAEAAKQSAPDEERGGSSLRGGFDDGGRSGPSSGWSNSRPSPPQGSSRFDCLKEDSGGRSRGGPGDRFGDRGPLQRGYYADSNCENDWWHRRDGRRINGWDTLSEHAIFGERRCNTGINFDEYDKIPVQVSGKDCSLDVKIERFSEAKLSDPLPANLDRCGYDRPTPVQKHSIPIVCEGRDVMACAQTGSGKTCAFMVPAIECLLRSGPPPLPIDIGRKTRPTPMPCVLVMAPTRELTSQIFEESRKFSYNSGIRCCVVYGGADMREQRRELNNGCDVLVATPGRLMDMFERGLVTLAFIQFLILDEADRMLDMGFEPQVRQLVDKTDLGQSAQRDRQSMMFSATFPTEVQIMAHDFLHDYVFLTVGRVGSASEFVQQMVEYVDDRDKVRGLEQVLDDHWLKEDQLVLIFVETKKGADSLERDLYQNGRLPCIAIHGDRSQSEREHALASFRSGRKPIMIATDVASRGLDIPNVHVVVNFDMPKSIDDYVHRIGRTGRVGNKGKSVAFVNDRCAGPLMRDLRDTLLESKSDCPSWFEDLCRQTRYGGGGGGKNHRKGGSRFGGRDIRQDFGGNWRGGSGGGGGYPDRRSGGRDPDRGRDAH